MNDIDKHACSDNVVAFPGVGQRVRARELFKAFRFVVRFDDGEWRGFAGVEPGGADASLRLYRAIGVGAIDCPTMPEFLSGEVTLRLFNATADLVREYLYTYQTAGIVPTVYLNSMDAGFAMECIELRGVRLVSIVADTLAKLDAGERTEDRSSVDPDPAP